MAKILKSHFFVIALLLIGITFLIPNIGLAHPGRTDSYGCHTCRTNCPKWGLSYGEYHCHGSKGITQPKEPIKSHLNKSGTGYIEPAPEYKIPAKVESKNSKQLEKNQENWFRKLLRVFRI